MSSIGWFFRYAFLRIINFVHGKTLWVNFFNRRHRVLGSCWYAMMQYVDVLILHTGFVEKGISRVGRSVDETDCHWISKREMCIDFVDGWCCVTLNEGVLRVGGE